MRVDHETMRNPDRFAEVFDAHAPKIYRYVVSQLRSREEAEDVTSTVFIRLWEYVQTRDGVIEHVQAFLFRIARHCVIDAVRRRRPTASVEEMQEGGTEIPDHRTARMTTLEDRDLVARGLDELNGHDRDILIWRFIEGIPVQQIAILLTVTENTASVRIYRALARLRKKIGI